MGPKFGSKDTNVSIHWFRHGLRLHDNPALLESLKNCDEFYPVFIFDGEVAGTKTAGFNRMRFLIESLKDLDESFRTLGSRLYVFMGEPVRVFGNLFREWAVTKLTFEEDPEPIWRARDNAVKGLCNELKVECVEKVSHNLWDPKEIIENNGGSPPLTYKMFNQVATTIGDPPRPVADPDFSGIKMPVMMDHDNKYGIPSLETLGIFPECQEQNARVNNWCGGESQALKLLQNRLRVEEMAFKTGAVMPNQSFPDLVGPPLSMSAHLRFGCLSVRKMYWNVQDAYVRIRPEEKIFNQSAIGQLMWREYFYTMSVNNMAYNRIKDNPICLQIEWYKDADKLQKWTEVKFSHKQNLVAEIVYTNVKIGKCLVCFGDSLIKGRTGYPWIDAIMKQLLHEGWIHHVARHAVSCFLTRGDLWISWEEGLAVFDKYLLDADWSVCAGNWLWMSSSAFENVFQCPKCFCPVRYGRRMDPSGAYIRRYLPVLKDMPLRYLFEPWTAPKAVQEKAKCIIGVDYPSPIVEHKKASKHCYNLMVEVRNMLIKAGKSDTPHCGPANNEEVNMFCWVNSTHRHQKGEPASIETVCDGLVDL